MQNYTEIADTLSLTASRAKLLDNDKTIMSCSSGTAFPTVDLQVGMLCLRTDEAKLYQLKSNGPAVWILIADLAANLDNLPRATTANWTVKSVISNVIGMLGWKNFGDNHVIFDASAGTSPTGSAVNNTNSAAVWSATYPTLMGWNGSSTYGVRVDSARRADSAAAADSATNATNATNATTAGACTGNAATVTNGVYTTGDQSIGGTKTFTGTTRLAHSVWHQDTNAYNRTYYASADSTYHRGYGGWFHRFHDGADTTRVIFEGAGNIYATGNIVAYWSDARLKENVLPLTGALESALRLRGVEFGWNETGRKLHGKEEGEREIGFIAQEVREVVPSAVVENLLGEDEEGKPYLTVRHERLIPLLVEGMRELSSQVAVLRGRIEQLEGAK